VARERGIEPVTLARGEGLEDFIHGVAAGGADALGVAGGDGSLAVVASAVAARGIPFVCVPAGTRNHFARDVGVAPNDLLGALDAFGAALERTVDLGYVNSRPFVNNVSFGIYGDAVGQAGYRDAKLRTLLETAEEEARGSGSVPADLHVVDDRGREHRSPAVVLVSNNPYAFERPPVRGARPTLDSGQLGIIVNDAPAGPPHPAGRAWSAQALSVEASGTIPAGVDGEAVTLAPPLHFTIQPKALRVRLAPGHVRQRGFPAHQPTARNPEDPRVTGRLRRIRTDARQRSRRVPRGPQDTRVSGHALNSPNTHDAARPIAFTVAGETAYPSERTGTMTVLATYTFGQALLTLLEFALLFLWIWIAIGAIADIFRSHDMSGWGKAAWLILIVLLPLLGVLIYLIARGHKMAEHAVSAAC